MCRNPTYIPNQIIRSLSPFHNWSYISNGTESFNIYHNEYLHICKSILLHSAYLDNTEDYLSDFFIYDTRGFKLPLFFAAPCRRCEECQLSYKSDIINRCIMEYASHPFKPIFFTLTYKDKFLPDRGVSKSDISKFINRLHIELRRVFNFSKVRHLIVSEYGTNPEYTLRPHYHGLLFGIDLDFNDRDNYFKFKKCLETAWSSDSELMGIIDFSVARSSIQTIRYATKYLLKQSKQIIKPGSYATFVSMPHVGGCLGTDYFITHWKEIILSVYNNTFLSVNTPDGVFKVSVPYIFKRKINLSFYSYLRSDDIKDIARLSFCDLHLYIDEFSDDELSIIHYFRTYVKKVPEVYEHPLMIKFLIKKVKTIFRSFTYSIFASVIHDIRIRVLNRKSIRYKLNVSYERELLQVDQTH